MNRTFFQACVIYIIVTITFLITQSIPYSFTDFTSSLVYLVLLTFLPMTLYIILWLMISEKITDLLNTNDKSRYLIYILINSAAPLLIFLIQGFFTWGSKLSYNKFINYYLSDYFSEWGFIVIGILPTLIKMALDSLQVSSPKEKIN